MKNELRQLIDAYCAKASELIPHLANAIKFKLPISNINWALLDIPCRGKTADGLEYYKHGYGVAIKYDGGEIDIDFGSQGEYNGFDAYRLMSFAEENNIPILYDNFRELESDFKDAEKKGQLRYSGYILYYLRDDC